jgi:hypothetical protein
MCDKDLLTTTIIVNTPIFGFFSKSKTCNALFFFNKLLTQTQLLEVLQIMFMYGLSRSYIYFPTTLTTKGLYTVTYSSVGPYNSLTVSHPTNVVSPSTTTVTVILSANPYNESWTTNSMSKLYFTCNYWYELIW